MVELEKILLYFINDTILTLFNTIVIIKEKGYEDKYHLPFSQKIKPVNETY